MDVVYIEFIKCELKGQWDYSESDMKSYYEAKHEPSVLEIWTKNDKKETYKFKKDAMVRISSNIIRFNREDTK